MSKLPGLSRQAKRDAEPFAKIDDMELLIWPEHKQLALTQGVDAVVVDIDMATRLMFELAIFIKNYR